MERVLEKLKTTNSNKKLVAEVLIKQCEREPAFIDKVLNEKKSLDDCWAYITAEAKKKAVSNAAVIGDATVYGWAIHYFDEAELEDRKSKTSAPKKSKTEVEEADDDLDEDGNDGLEDDEETPKQKPKSKKKETSSKKQLKGIAEGQISLF